MEAACHQPSTLILLATLPLELHAYLLQTPAYSPFGRVIVEAASTAGSMASS